LETKLFTGEQTSQIEQLDQYLKTLSIELKKHCELKPQLKLNNLESNVISIDKATKPLESYLKQAFELYNAVVPLPVGSIGGPMDSKIIDRTQSAMLESWFGRYASLKLLLRGSKDGWTKQVFNQKRGSYQHTVCLIKATTGKIFGGYSDQTLEKIKENLLKMLSCFQFVTKRSIPINLKIAHKLRCVLQVGIYFCLGGVRMIWQFTKIVTQLHQATQVPLVIIMTIKAEQKQNLLGQSTALQ
jgi:hypothetical protein